MRSKTLRLILLVLSAKLLYLALVYHRDPGPFLAPDTATYERPALALLAYGVYAQNPAAPTIPELNRTPGYPVFIALTYALFGRRPWLLVISNILFSAASTWLVFSITRRLFDDRAAFLAALVCSLEPSSFHYSTVALSEAPFVLLTLLFAYGFVRFADDPEMGSRWGFAAGAAIGGAVLVRPILYYFAPVVVFLAVWVARRRGLGWGRCASVALSVLAPVLLLVGAWQVRNWKVSGGATVSTVQSADLYFHRAAPVQADVEGTALAKVRERFGWTEFLYRFGYAENEQAAFGADRYADLHPVTSRLSNIELSRLWERRAIDILLSHPWVTLKHTAIGLLLLLFSPSVILWGYSLKMFRPSEEFIQAWNSIDGTAMLQILAREHPVVLALSVLCVVALALLYGAFLFGLSKGQLRANGAAHAAILCTVTYLLLVNSGAEAIEDRYRVPLIPFYALYAGAGLAAFFPRSGPGAAEREGSQ